MASFTPEAFSLHNTSAFITGAASGIGRAIALGFAACGADVTCFDLDRDGAQATADRIVDSGRRAIAVAGDTTDADALAEAVKRAEKEIGPLKAAVNCAGIVTNAPSEELDAAEFRRIVDVNLTGVFLSAQAEGRVMLPRGRGSIVNIASMSGTIANRDLKMAHYNSSKAAVAHLTRSLATEWANCGIRVNAISPGYTRTPIIQATEDLLAEFAKEIPLQRIAEPEEIVGAAVFLSSAAASYCTGVDLLVDGGYVCW
jgi:NAD(P)-dependent dehydrogenase (short-subunit alcohol dehydrogenase family)